MFLENLKQVILSSNVFLSIVISYGIIICRILFVEFKKIKHKYYLYGFNFIFNNLFDFIDLRLIILYILIGIDIILYLKNFKFTKSGTNHDINYTLAIELLQYETPSFSQIFQISAFYPESFKLLMNLIRCKQNSQSLQKYLLQNDNNNNNKYEIIKYHIL